MSKSRTAVAGVSAFVALAGAVGDFQCDPAPIDPASTTLAAITCPAHGAVGELLAFSSAGTTSELPPVEYRFEFGDGASAIGPMASHAYAQPGAWRAVLTVRDGSGFEDRSTCVVSVGDFPTWTGPIDAVEFIPSYWLPRIEEKGAPPWFGGRILGFFDAPGAVTIDEIRVNGVVADPDQGGEVQWCEIVDETLEAGEIGIVRCFTRSENLDDGKPATLEVRAGGQTVWSHSTVLAAPELSPSYITATVALDGILVHVRNDSDRDLALTGLSIDGTDVSAFVAIDNPDLEPGEVGIIRVPRPDGVPLGQWLTFTVHGADGGLDVIRESRALRLFRPHFGVGTWTEGDGADADGPFADMDELQFYLDGGIDTFLWSPSEAAPPEVVFDLAERHDFFVYLHQGTPRAEFAAEWGDHPRLVGNAVSGEADGSDPRDTLAKIRENRELFGGNVPLWVYNACSIFFAEWNPLGDIGGQNHYCIWAPKCNDNWPWFQNDLFEFAALYTDVSKRASEPAPSWQWVQGLYRKSLRCPTGDEIRGQWNQIIGRGAKSMHWFMWRTSLVDECPRSALDMIPRLRREVDLYKGLLLEGDVAQRRRVAYSKDPTVDVAATVAPDGIVVFVQNMRYTPFYPWWITGLEWFDIDDVQVRVRAPQDFEPFKAYLVGDGVYEELEFGPVADESVPPNEKVYAFRIPRLHVSETVVVVPEP